MSFTVPTSERVQLKDITREVAAEVEKSGIKDGIALVYVPHATAALLINEHETGLISDLTGMVKEAVPRDRAYEHDRIDNNAWSHLTSALLGCSVMLPITGGRIERGTWQNIFLVELDGPRQRKVIVKTIGK
ncbi:MAG: secondary thiamine-phosphate synthase enzyme YjbQ [Firmicutes bacterium]|nr:secondary thiamine-phosphate synthase enzyme YjbQ [Bacillota bacterium]